MIDMCNVWLSNSTLRYIPNKNIHICSSKDKHKNVPGSTIFNSLKLETIIW